MKYLMLSHGLRSDDSRDWIRPVVMLVAGIINDHILSCKAVGAECDEADELCAGCCTECCGPCSSLAWLRDNENDVVTQWLADWDRISREEAMAKYPDEDWSEPPGRWSWQNDDGSINWKMIEAHWHGCPNHED